MTQVYTETGPFAVELVSQGLSLPETDLDGMMGMAKDLAASAKSMRVRRAYALESLSGFSLAPSEDSGDE